MKHVLTSLGALAAMSGPAFAQTETVQVEIAPTQTTQFQTAGASDVAVAAPSQAYCVSIMSGFPNDDTVARYQFFRLTQDIAQDATPQFRATLAQYGEADVSQDTPILEVIEAIANPVLRQAAPEMVIGYMDHLIQFEDRCETYISGQVDSLKAYDADLVWEDPIIAEDALFLRQVLSDSLDRVGANNDPVHSFAAQQYAQSLITTRDNMEYQVFVSDIDELETLYMTDLDGRLARSNDIINEEMDREVLGDAVILSDDMNKAAREQEKQRTLYTLIRILGGGY